MELILAPAIAPQPGPVVLDQTWIQRINIKTSRARKALPQRRIRARAITALPTTAEHDVVSRVDGWIEHVYIDSTWSNVAVGSPLFDVYSPELYNAQVSYLTSVHSEGPQGGVLTRGAIERLNFYQLSKQDISDILQEPEVKRTYCLASRFSGTVTEILVRQGSAIRRGDILLRIADYTALWAIAEIQAADAPCVRLGQVVCLVSNDSGGAGVIGKVISFAPEVTSETQTISARIEFDNSSAGLKPGRWIEADFSTQNAPLSILIPVSAAVHEAELVFVFVETKAGCFERRLVQLGAPTDTDEYPVLSGLAEGERVVTSGQFLLNAESLRHISFSSEQVASTPRAPRSAGNKQ
jgi:hypothetical protein